MKHALHSWAGNYPEVLDSRELGGEVQHLLKRAIYQGDENTHWFCSCREFELALNSQQAGSLSNIANQKPLRCEHIDEITGEKMNGATEVVEEKVDGRTVLGKKLKEEQKTPDIEQRLKKIEDTQLQIQAILIEHGKKIDICSIRR